MSSYILEYEKLGLKARVGFDHALNHYFLVVALFDKSFDESPDEDETEEESEEECVYYDVDELDPWLPLLEMEAILARLGLGLPFEICELLIANGKGGGDAESVAGRGLFYWDVASSSMVEWKPKGALPNRWYQELE